MAYPLVGTPGVAAGNVSTLTCALPAGIVSGDLVVVQVSINYNAGATTTNVPTASGMTFAAIPGWTADKSAGGLAFRGYYAVAGASDSSKTVTATITGTAGKYSLLPFVLDGTLVDQTTPFVSGSFSGIGYNPGTATASHVAPSYTTTQSSYIVGFLSDKGSPPSQHSTTQPTVAGATYVNIGDTNIAAGTTVESGLASWSGATPIASGTVVGGGTWVTSVATTSTGVALVAVNPATVASLNPVPQVVTRAAVQRASIY